MEQEISTGLAIELAPPPPDTLDLEIQGVLKRLSGLRITSDESMVVCAEELKKAKACLDAIDAHYQPDWEATKIAHDVVVEERKERRKPVEDLVAIVKRQLADYHKAETARRIEAQRETGIPAAAPPKVKGIAYVKVIKFRIIDESLVPAEFRMLDEKKIGAYGRAMGDKASLPGVEFYVETTERVTA